LEIVKNSTAYLATLAYKNSLVYTFAGKAI